MIDEKVLIERLLKDKRVGRKSFEVIFGIVKDFASENNNRWIEQLLEAKKNCGEDSDCSECPFGQIEDRCILQELQIEKDNGWISVEDELPQETFGCIVNVMDYEPMTQTEFENILPYSVGYDGKTWNDIDGAPIPFEVIAWQPLPSAPYKKGE